MGLGINIGIDAQGNPRFFIQSSRTGIDNLQFLC